MTPVRPGTRQTPHSAWLVADGMIPDRFHFFDIMSDSASHLQERRTKPTYCTWDAFEGWEYRPDTHRSVTGDKLSSARHSPHQLIIVSAGRIDKGVSRVTDTSQALLLV
jgi:hypothetical protein